MPEFPKIIKKRFLRQSVQRLCTTAMLLMSLVSVMWWTNVLDTLLDSTNALGRHSVAAVRSKQQTCSHSFSPATHPNETYGIIIDAGSTGSRIHVYKFTFCTSASPELHSEVFEQLKPGLSHYARQDPLPMDFALSAAKSLDSLLKKAMLIVPKRLHLCTPVTVKATAGLRLLPGNNADLILDAVEAHLSEKYPFELVKNADGRAVTIIDGKDEAMYAWVTVNYLLRRFASVRAPTAAIMDLGGGSTQIVFEPNFHDPSLNPKEQPMCSVPPPMLKSQTCGTFYQNKQLGSSAYTLYQHSYLGYGLMEARSRIKNSIVQKLLAHLNNKDHDKSQNKVLMEGVTFIGDLAQKKQLLESYSKHINSKLEGTVHVLAQPCIARGHFEIIPEATIAKVAAVAGVKLKEKSTILMTGSVDQTDMQHQCAHVSAEIFDLKHPCTYDPPHCSFNGIYQPSLTGTFTRLTGADVFAFSYFYDRTRVILDLDHEDDDPKHPLQGSDRWLVQDFKYLAESVCHISSRSEQEETVELHKTLRKLSTQLTSHFKSPDEIEKRIAKYVYNQVEADPAYEHNPELCMDLTFMYQLFSIGYGLPDTQPVIIRKKIDKVETGWCLGAMIEIVQGLSDRKKLCKA